MSHQIFLGDHLSRFQIVGKASAIPQTHDTRVPSLKRFIKIPQRRRMIRNLARRIYFITHTALVQFSGELGRPLQNMARLRERGRHEADSISFLALSLRLTVPISCVRPQCTFSPRLRGSSLALPTPQRVRQGRDDDARLGAVAFCRSLTARTGSLMRYTSIPQSELIRDASLANLAQISGRGAATTCTGASWHHPPATALSGLPAIAGMWEETSGFA